MIPPAPGSPAHSPGSGPGPGPGPGDPAGRATVRHLVLEAVAAERAATGPDRLTRYRDTRRLLGAAYRAGFTPEFLAAVIGVRAATLKTRIDPPATMSVGAFLGLLPTRLADRARATRAIGARDEESQPTEALLRWALRQWPHA